MTFGTPSFSTITGVTSGLYSWKLTAAGSPDYGAALTGPASTSLTALLGNAASISMDIVVPQTGDFGFGEQIDLGINLPGYGYMTLDNGNYTGGPVGGGPGSTMTWTVPASVRNILISNPTLAASLTFKIGGGAGGTMYIDNLRATLLPPRSCQSLFPRTVG